MIKSFEEFHGLNESKDVYTLPKREMKIAKAAKNHPAPYTVIAVDLRNKRVVGQEIGLKTWEAIPAAMLKLSRDFPNARVHVEDHGGAVILESADMLPSYEVIAGLATALGALDLAQAARGGKSIILDVAKLLRAELGSAVEATGAKAKQVVDKYKGNPKVKGIIMDAEETVNESKKSTTMKISLFEEYFNEAYIGPFVFSDRSSDEELRQMHKDAVSGYAYWEKGLKYPKSDYKKAYQEIEKIAKKRGLALESVNPHNAMSIEESEIKFYKTISKKEWDKTHRDSKSIINGVHYKMFFDSKLGTILAPVQISEGLNEREYSDAQREAMADSGEAMPDGSFPIADEADLKNAIQAYGRAKNQSATAKHIAKRARALGLSDLLPQTPDFQASLK
jgi:hypothetical protein